MSTAGIAQADEVAAARFVGAAGVPEFALFVAGRVGLHPAGDHHVEIARAQPVDVLGDVHKAYLHVDAQLGEVALVGQQHALEVGLGEHEFEAQRLAVGVYHAVVDDLVAGVEQQPVGLALLLADDAAAVAHRRAEDAVEDLRRQLVAQRLENLQFFGVGELVGSHFGVLEVAAIALVRAEEHLFVGPLEVEQQADGFAYAGVLEYRAAQVEDETLHAPGAVVMQFFADDAAVAHRRRLVGGGPVLRDALFVEVELPGLEGFQGDGQVAVGIYNHGIEVVEAAIDRQVPRPVILDRLVAYRAPRVDLGDAVRAAAQRRFQAGLAEVAAGPPVFGQDRQLAEYQRQFAVARALEVEAHAQAVLGHHLVDVRIVVAVHRVALAHQALEGEHHVLGGDRRAVVEACLRAQVEAHEALLRVFLDLFREQSVLGERLVQGVEGQGVVDQVDLRSRIALGNERIEAVEAAEIREPQGAALGRFGVDVGEVLEVGGILRRLVVEGDGVLWSGVGQACQAQQGGGQQAAHHGFVSRRAAAISCRPPRVPMVGRVARASRSKEGAGVWGLGVGIMRSSGPFGMALFVLGPVGPAQARGAFNTLGS